MKKTILILFCFVSFSTAVEFASASSGACSYHSGVNCSIGSTTDGNAVCNDGTESSVSYVSMKECTTVNTLPPVQTNDSFSRKQQCARYTNTIQNEIINTNSQSEANEKIHPGNSITSILDEVFYSPVVNSCLYTEITDIKGTDITLQDGTIFNLTSKSYSINDYLDNESSIYSAVLKPSESASQNESKITDFYNKVSYYKGNVITQNLSAKRSIFATTPISIDQASSSVNKSTFTFDRSETSATSSNATTNQLSTSTQVIPQESRSIWTSFKLFIQKINPFRWI